jgi:tetratricopeptide (TPR) repeat protein
LVGLFRYPKRRLRKLIQKGEYKEAIELGKSLEEKFSNDPDFFFIMGSIYYILEDAKNTLFYFDKSLAINENDIETLLLKANVHLFLKELNPVIDCCEKVLEIDPENSRAKEILDNLSDD